MSRRRRLRSVVCVLVAVAVFVTVAAACGDDEEAGEGTGAGEVVRADLARSDPVPAAAAPVADAVAAFALDLHHALVADGAGNLVVSPHSIAVALAMTRAGAAGTTLTEMDDVLHLGGVADPDAGFNTLDQQLAARAGEFERPDGSSGDVELAVANALWGQDGYGFLDDFLTTLAGQYGAGMRIVDFAADTEGARRTINDWVADQTRDRIDELIAEGVLSPDTRLVLTNAVYLYAPWLSPFEEAATAPGDFTTLDGDVVPVDMMRQTGSLGYAGLEGMSAVELPYLGDELALLVIVPDPGTFTEVEDELDAQVLANVVGALTPMQVSLGVPRFEVRSQVGLVDALRALGMGDAFDPGAADFSAMTGDRDLYVSDVVHEAFIAVDEDGTEAAAATAVIMSETSAPAEPVQLTIDRPFLFALRDTTTGAVLFLGRVVDPTA